MAIDPLQELVVLGARIYTHAGAPPVEALLVRAGRVVAAGTVADIRARAGRDAATLDLGGGHVTPGLTDAHIHMTAWALARRRVALQGAASAAEAAERVRDAAPPGDGWVLGQGWQANAWAEPPTSATLDAHFPARPVALESQDLHGLWVNTEALRRAGVNAGTPDPQGGRIVRDTRTGEPTGVLLENARALVLDHVPAASVAETQAALDAAQAALHGWGITGVHSVEPTGLADFRRMQRRGALRLRVLQTIPLHQAEAALALELDSGHGGPWLRTGGVKMFLDGALGSRTAWLREPYEGDAANRGIETLPAETFREMVARLAAQGIATTVHAIGDAAVELALEVLAAHPAQGLTMPHRIEHLQLCPPELWARAAASGIVASVQPIHLMTDIPAAERHWGPARCRGAYAFAPLLRGGMTLAFGSDAPVESPDPRLGLYAATARVGWDGRPEGGWFPEHLLTAEEALRAYTEGPALAAGRARRQGRLLTGYDADLACWDRDPFRASPAELREMRCQLTMVGGAVVHEAGAP